MRAETVVCIDLMRETSVWVRSQFESGDKRDEPARTVYEKARDVAWAMAKTEAFERSRRDRKRVEMLFAHLKRIPRLGRLRLRGPRGAQFEFTLAGIAQNLRRVGQASVQTAGEQR